MEFLARRQLYSSLLLRLSLHELFKRDILELFFLFVEPLEQVSLHHQLLELLGILELQVCLHQRYANKSRLLLQECADVAVFDMIENRVRVLVKRHIVLPQHLQEAFGLTFELGGSFGDPGNDLFVCELFEAVVDVAALLMRPHHALRPVEEPLLNLDKRLFRLVPALNLIKQLVHHWLVANRLIQSVIAIHLEQVLKPIPAHSRAFSFISIRVLFEPCGLHAHLIYLGLQVLEVVSIGAFVFGHVAHEAKQLHLALHLGHSLSTIKVAVAFAGQGGSPQNPRLIKLAVKDLRQLLLNCAECLVLRVALPSHFLVLLHEVEDGVGLK